jgi:hypothetical protein
VHDNKTVLGVGKKWRAFNKRCCLAQSQRERSPEDVRQFPFPRTDTIAEPWPINRKVFARRIGKRANKKMGVYSQIAPSFTAVVIARPIAEIGL